MPRLTFIDEDGASRSYPFHEGDTVLAVARRHHVALEGACEGAMACATCHVMVDPAWFARLPKARPEENAMLDLAAGVKRTSRLGCQMVLTNDLDGLTVRICS